MKLFVTGVYGSGKTYLARKIAKENNKIFVSYDEFIDYQNINNKFDWLMSIVPESFVMDAIPLDNNMTWNKFLEYQKKHSCQIVCCYCPDVEVWMERVKQKQIPDSLIVRIMRRLNMLLKLKTIAPEKFFSTTARLCLRFIKRFFTKINISIKNKFFNNSDNSLEPNITDQHYDNYWRFISKNFIDLQKMKNVRWYDSIANEYTTVEEALKRIKLNSSLSPSH